MSYLDYLKSKHVMYFIEVEDKSVPLSASEQYSKSIVKSDVRFPANFAMLRYFSCANCDLSSIPQEIGTATALTDLVLAENNLTELPDSLCACTNLTQLNARRNKLTRLPDEMHRLDQLKVLQLDENKIERLPERLVVTMTKLLELGLSENCLTELPLDLSLEKLEEMRVSHNRIIAVPCSIGVLTSLVSLQLHHNQLISLPKEIGCCTNLTRLTVDSNRLSEMPMEISRLTKMVTITLDRNEMRKLPVELGRMKKLEVVHWEGNPVEYPPLEVRIRPLKEMLKWLRGYHTQDASDKNLLVLPDVLFEGDLSRRLLLDGNRLETIPLRLCQLQSLRYLHLTITSIRKEIAQLSGLLELFVDDNRLSWLPSSIQGLTSLVALGLSHNQISTLPIELGALTNIRILKIWGNPLRQPLVSADFEQKTQFLSQDVPENEAFAAREEKRYEEGLKTLGRLRELYFERKEQISAAQTTTRDIVIRLDDNKAKNRR